MSLKNNKQLKHYLVLDENAYLFNENNNGSIIMISGAWGAGKTHFWKHEIEPVIKNILAKNKAYVYTSLYGKDSLNDIKMDIYLSASGRKILSDEVSTFGIEALSAIKDSNLAIGRVIKAGKIIIDSQKTQKGISKLKRGGIICFDDFERKSKKIDLNDIFGFISQLSMNIECKIIIILNSEVFKGEEANIFSSVKEKTISKYFFYDPTIDELLYSIITNSKYNILDKYRDDILSIIKETNEINARIYIQALNNCMEWLKVKKTINKSILRVLILGTFNFVLNHLILDYQKIMVDSNYNACVKYDVISFVAKLCNTCGCFADTNTEELYKQKVKNTTSEYYLIDELKKRLTDYNTNHETLYSHVEQEEYYNLISLNQEKLKAVWKYGHILHYTSDVNKKTYIEISRFIESGILLP